MKTSIEIGYCHKCIQARQSEHVIACVFILCALCLNEANIMNNATEGAASFSYKEAFSMNNDGGQAAVLFYAVIIEE